MSSPRDPRQRTDVARSLNIGIGRSGARPRQLATRPPWPCKPADPIAEASPPHRKAVLDTPAGLPSGGRLSCRRQGGGH
jgi:hypothetical protein